MSPYADSEQRLDLRGDRRDHPGMGFFDRARQGNRGSGPVPRQAGGSGEPELVLRGHREIIARLVTVRTDDGRVLLVSADPVGTVWVWDPATGELLDGPVAAGDVRTKLAGLRLGPVELARAAGDHVVPATAGTPARIVTLRHLPDRVQVIEPGTDQVVFDFMQPPNSRGPLGEQVLGDTVSEVAGLRFDDGTSGFVASRWGGDVELWAPRRGTWHKTLLTTRHPGVMAVVDTGSSGSHLAVRVSGGFEVWDVSGPRRLTSVSLGEGTGAEALAAVPLAGGTVVAVALLYSKGSMPPGGSGGVRLYDPYSGKPLGGVFNLPGLGFEKPGFARSILALTPVPGPGGTVRVASAGNDYTIRISAPVGKASD